MKKLASYLLLLLAIGLIITAPLFGQSKRIGEIVEMSGMAATFSKNQPRGTIVLEESALELWYLFNYTPAGTTLGAASKVKISADALNGIYSGSDTVPSATMATLTDFLAFNGTVRILGKGSTSSTQSLQIASQSGANFSVNDAGEVDSRLGYWIGGGRVFHKSGGTNNLWGGLSSGNQSIGSSDENTYYGDIAGSNTQGDNNSGFGAYALQFVTNGINNLAAGRKAAQVYTSNSSDNTILGANSGGNGLNVRNRNTLTGSSVANNIRVSENLSLYGYLSRGSTSGDYSNSCAFGAYTLITGNNQFVTGSYEVPMVNYYFGRGVEQTSSNIGSSGVALNATSIQAGQTNASAAIFPFSINGSQGTGTGVGGDILFKFAPAGASGSSQNTLQTALQITPTTERIVSHYTHQFNDGINFNDTPTWVFKEIEIGQWNMDATDSVIVLHGIANWQSIRDVAVIVRNDEDVETRHYVLNDQLNKATHTYYNADYFYLFREITGLFDSTNFDAVTDGVGGEYNRGWITFWYKV